jgi:predicted N-acetyltransferase YhbS
MNLPSIRPYQAPDLEACLALFDANCPAYFSPNEREEYLQFLKQEPAFYRVCLLNGQIIGAFGLDSESNIQATLRWLMVSSPLHGRRIGSAIMHQVLAQAQQAGTPRVRIAASHKSAPFFERFGARSLQETPHGWGPGMHRVDMEIQVLR